MSREKTGPAFHPGQGGFTLLEALIAVAILAIGLVSVFISQSGSLSLATEAQFNTIAPKLAQSKLSELRGEGGNFLLGDSGEFSDEYSGYRWELEIEEASFDFLEVLEQLEAKLVKVQLSVTLEASPFKHVLIYYSRQDG